MGAYSFSLGQLFSSMPVSCFQKGWIVWTVMPSCQYPCGLRPYTSLVRPTIHTPKPVIDWTSLNQN